MIDLTFMTWHSCHSYHICNVILMSYIIISSCHNCDFIYNNFYIFCQNVKFYVIIMNLYLIIATSYVIVMSIVQFLSHTYDFFVHMWLNWDFIVLNPVQWHHTVVSSMDLCPFLYHYLTCIIPLVNCARFLPECLPHSEPFLAAISLIQYNQIQPLSLAKQVRLKRAVS